MELEEPTVTNIKNLNSIDNNLRTLQILQTWFSSSFPIGSYSYSHGIEAMINEEFFNDPKDVLEFIEGIIFHGTCKNDSILIKLAYDGLNVNDLSLALNPSKERKSETLAMGNAFRKVMTDSWNFHLPKDTSYPIGVAKAGIYFKIPLNQLLLFYALPRGPWPRTIPSVWTLNRCARLFELPCSLNQNQILPGRSWPNRS